MSKLTQERLKELLKLNPETHGFNIRDESEFWNAERREFHPDAHNDCRPEMDLADPILKRAEVGLFSPSDDCWIIHIDGINYWSDALARLYMTGTLPADAIWTAEAREG